MQRLFVPLVSTSWLALLAGCSAYWPLSDELQDAIAREAVLEPQLSDHDAVKALAKEAVEGTMPSPQTFELPPTPALADYVRLALERNPKIQSMVRNLEALGMKVPQVTSLDDPLFTLIPPTGDLVETAAGQVDATIGISQAVPFPSKLAARGRIAEQIVRVGLENLRATRLGVVAEVKKAYYAYYFSHVSIRVTRENQRLLQRIRDAARGKFEAGTAPQQDVLRAEVELYQLSNNLLTLTQERRTSLARLNVLMDRDIDAELPAPTMFDAEGIQWQLKDLMARAVKVSPKLKAIQERVQADLESVHLAKLDYLPDLVVGAGYSFIGGGISPVATRDNVWNLALGVRLPIWIQRIRAGIFEKNANALANALEYRSRRNDVFFAIQDALIRVDTQYQSAILFRDAILPKANQTVEASESGYQAGDVDFLTWIDNWRKLLILSLQYHQALASLEQSFAVLEELVGGELARSPSDDQPPEPSIPPASPEDN